MKFCWSGKKTCRWCYWRGNKSPSGESYCEAMPTIQIPVRGCFCGHCLHRRNGMCPLVGGMKKPEDWCPQGTERLIAVAEVHLDNTCAMFRPLDLAHLDSGNHPLSVRRAAEKLKAKRVDRKSNPGVLPPAAPAGREQRVVGGPND